MAQQPALKFLGWLCLLFILIFSGTALAAPESRGEQNAVRTDPSHIGLAASAGSDSLSQLVYATYLGGAGDDGGIEHFYQHFLEMEVDDLGNVYLTGYTTSTSIPGATRSSNDGDAFVAKIRADGSLAFTRFLGGSMKDGPLGIAVDGGDFVYVVGSTQSQDFPVVGGYDTSFNGGNEPTFFYGDAFVAKLDANTGELLASTFLGGSGVDLATGVAVDAQNTIYITGYFSATTNIGRQSFVLPAAGSDTIFDGPRESFVARLDADLNGYRYFTFMGRNPEAEQPDLDNGQGTTSLDIVVDEQGAAYITGMVWESNVVKPTYLYGTKSGDDVFVAKVNPGGMSFDYLTMMAGSNHNAATAITLDNEGNAYITGRTYAAFPVKPQAYITTHNNYVDGFVAKLAADGSRIFASYLGGKMSGGNDIAVDIQGNVYVTGFGGKDFPVTAGNIQGCHVKSFRDAFVTVLDPTGSHLIYSTCIGGSIPTSGKDDGTAITLRDNLIYVAGTTWTTNFTVTQNALQANAGSVTGMHSDAFLVQLDRTKVSIDTDGDGLDDNWEQALLEMYRPYFVFDAEEARWPTSPRWFAQHSYLRNNRDEEYPQDAIYTLEELQDDPILVLSAAQRGHEPSDLSQVRFPYTPYHIDLYEEDAYCGEGALAGCENGTPPDTARLPKIPIYAVVHLVEDDQESDQRLDTTGLYRLHFQYGFALSSVNLGTHEGDWERLDVYVDPNVDPYNNNAQHREQMLRGIKHYAHCESGATLTLPSDTPYFPRDGIPTVYVGPGQHGFFRWPDPGIVCKLDREADGDGVSYRVENVVNLGERYQPLIRLEERKEQAEDRAIALLFNGTFGERKSATAADGVLAPGRRLPRSSSTQVMRLKDDSECRSTFDFGGDRLAAGDMDGDGTAEILVAEDDGGAVRVFRVDLLPNSEFCLALVNIVDTNFDMRDSLAAGDMDGDGRAEILVAEDDGGLIQFYSGNGDVIGSVDTSYDRGGDRIAAADFLGDSKDEILVAEDDGGVIEVYDSNGSLRARSSEISTCRSTFDHGGDDLGAGDVNGDGTAEILVAEDNGGEVRVYRPSISGSALCLTQIEVISTTFARGSALSVGNTSETGIAATLIAEPVGGIIELYMGFE